MPGGRSGPTMKPKSRNSGITVGDVLNAFPGARVLDHKPAFCSHCRKESEGLKGNKVTLITTDYDGIGGWVRRRTVQTYRLETPKWRRDSKIVLREWPDGRIEWACHFCGRATLIS